MARIRFVPHDQDREDIKREDRADRRAMRHCPLPPDPNDPQFGLNSPEDPEFQSVEAFTDWLSDDDRETYTRQELACLNYHLKMRIQVIKESLEEWGLTLEQRRAPKTGRGYNAWDGNRFSSPC